MSNCRQNTVQSSKIKPFSVRTRYLGICLDSWWKELKKHSFNYIDHNGGDTTGWLFRKAKRAHFTTNWLTPRCYYRCLLHPIFREWTKDMDEQTMRSSEGGVSPKNKTRRKDIEFQRKWPKQWSDGHRQINIIKWKDKMDTIKDEKVTTHIKDSLQ